MHTLVWRVFKWNYEQQLYSRTLMPTDIKFAATNVPLIGIVVCLVFNLNPRNLEVYLNTPAIVCIRIYGQVIHTNGTKKLWDFKIAADIQEWSINQIYVDTYVI